MNVTKLLSEMAIKFPDAPAILTAETSLSYPELNRAVSWTAKSLDDAGLTSGNMVAIDLSDQVQHLVTSLALARLGVGQITLDSADPPRLRQQLARQLEIVTTVSDKPREANTLPSLIKVPFNDIHDLKGLKPIEFEAVEGSSLALLVMRTSGTSSGVAKFGLLTHASAHPRIRAKGFTLPEGPGSRYLSLGSLSLNSVKLRAFHCVLSGGCLALDGGASEPQAVVAFIEAHDVNYISCSPVHAAALLDIAKDDKLLLPGVRALRVGSSFVPQPLREDILRRLTPNLFIAYGIMEIGTVSIATPKLVREVYGVVGNLVPGLQAQTVDEDDVPLPAGKAGRLRLKSPGMIDRYVGAPADSERVFRNGWFYSDDRVTFTRNRELVYHGRLDDMMIFDGININPAEIENALLLHPAVSEASAFSIKSSIHGDTPFVAVVTRSTVSEEILLSHCRSLLGRHAPKGVYIVASLPRNAAGKVLKRDLRKLFG